MKESYQIAIGKEELIPLKDELGKLLSQEIGGRRMANSTVYRWAVKGKHGVRLPTLRLKRSLFTTLGAFSWWAQTVAATEHRNEERIRTQSSRDDVEVILVRAGIVAEGSGRSTDQR